MAANNPYHLTIAEAGPLLRAKSLSPLELTKAYLDRIEALNPAVNAFITVLKDEALAQAQAAEKEIVAGHYRAGRCMEFPSR